jgi:hypothetical protein
MRWLIWIGLFWSLAMIVAMALCRAAGVADAAANPKQMGNAMRDLHQDQQQRALKN